MLIIPIEKSNRIFLMLDKFGIAAWESIIKDIIYPLYSYPINTPLELMAKGPEFANNRLKTLNLWLRWIGWQMDQKGEGRMVRVHHPCLWRHKAVTVPRKTPRNLRFSWAVSCV